MVESPMKTPSKKAVKENNSDMGSDGGYFPGEEKSTPTRYNKNSGGSDEEYNEFQNQEFDNNN
jgi:hypothetical protein